jgi:DNA polymerase-3 subunit gamma/tau
MDLAGYYRSLLLIKAGITKESLLGYGANRYSRVWEQLNLPQLEEGLSILLALYRDIRYSLSPRFELEAAVSKLSWLNKWVSPAELRSAVEAARNVLGGQAAGTAENTPDSQNKNPDYGVSGQATVYHPENVPADKGQDEAAEKSGTLAEGFKQFLAQRGEQKTEVTVNEDAETVRRIFRGTYVSQGGNE